MPILRNNYKELWAWLCPKRTSRGLSQTWECCVYEMLMTGATCSPQYRVHWCRLQGSDLGIPHPGPKGNEFPTAPQPTLKLQSGLRHFPSLGWLESSSKYSQKFAAFFFNRAISQWGVEKSHHLCCLCHTTSEHGLSLIKQSRFWLPYYPAFHEVPE